jgi:hypothetical protein
MRKIFVFILLFMFLAMPSYAFLYEITILSSEEIAKLSNDDLKEVYIEARIEKKASGEFHAGAGFSSKKPYEKRKDLLRYIFDLKQEMGKREEVETEKIDEYLK